MTTRSPLAHRSLTSALLACLSLPASAAVTVTVHQPGLTVLETYHGPLFTEVQHARIVQPKLAAGAMLGVNSEDWPSYTWTRLNADRTVDRLVSIHDDECGVGFSDSSADRFDGTVSVVVDCDVDGLQKVYVISGLPVDPQACLDAPGDLAPGMLDSSTMPPRWRPEGDGRVNVADVVALLRAAVGLQVVDCGP